MHGRRIKATLVAAVLVAGTAIAKAPEALAADAPLGVVTNSPSSPKAISNRIEAFVDNAPAGSIIRIAQYRLNSDSSGLIGSLVDAFDRGVNVRIVLDNSAENDKPFTASPTLFSLRKKIVARYGAWDDTSKGSFIVLCADGCVGQLYQHNKFYLFTKSGSRSQVVVESTANVADDNNVAWNAAYAFAGHPDLYTAFADYFFDMAHKSSNANYYRSTTDGNLKAYFFPRLSSTGDQDDPSTDTIIGILNNVRCTGNTTVGTSTNHRTIIRIAMWGFTREEVAKKLRSLADSDCWIDIALNQGGAVSPAVEAYLKNHPRINVDNASYNGWWLHAKYVLIEGNYDGTADNKVAWLGSHNLTLDALRHDDESLLKIDSGADHDDLRTQFREIMAASPNYQFG